MAKQLTAVSVANARPGPQRREIPDAGCRGLYLVVQPSGRKSWAVRYRFAGKPRKVTLDGALTLAAARKAAAEALHELERGNDPAALKSGARATAAALAADTVDKWAEQFIELHARRKTRALTLAQYESVLRRLVLPAWRGRTVHDIKRRDVIELLEQIALDRPIMANRTLGGAQQVLQLAVRARRDRGLALRRGEAAERGARARPRSLRRRNPPAVDRLRRHRRAGWRMYQDAAADRPAAQRGSRHAPLRDQRRRLVAAGRAHEKRPAPRRTVVGGKCWPSLRQCRPLPVATTSSPWAARHSAISIASSSLLTRR